MAFRPSLRRHTKVEEVELNLTPIMNLMVVMIPLLLSSTTFVTMGVIELNLPPAAGASGSAAAAAMPKEAQRTLDLTISITDRAFYISSAVSGPQAPDSSGPTIPKRPDNAYDYDRLSQKLYEVKQKAQDQFPDIEDIIIQAERDIQY